MKKIAITLICLAYLIYLRPDAQVGPFEDKKIIQVSHTGIRIGGRDNIRIDYNGSKYFIPWRSILFIREISDKKPEKEQ